MELEGTEIFKKIESLIKTYYNIPEDNQFLNAFDKGMELKKKVLRIALNIFKKKLNPHQPRLMMKN